MSKTNKQIIESITKQINEWVVLKSYYTEMSSTLENLLQNIELEHLDPLEAVAGYIKELNEDFTKLSPVDDDENENFDETVLIELLRFLRTL